MNHTGYRSVAMVHVSTRRGDAFADRAGSCSSGYGTGAQQAMGQALEQLPLPAPSVPALPPTVLIGLASLLLAFGLVGIAAGRKRTAARSHLPSFIAQSIGAASLGLI